MTTPAPEKLSLWLETLRNLGSLLLSVCIGFERETHEKPAGLKTHMIVGVGSRLFALLTVILIGRYQSEMVRVDPVCIVSAATFVVAFLAAGINFRPRGKVFGLTTGGSLWMAGAVGLACGLASSRWQQSPSQRSCSSCRSSRSLNAVSSGGASAGTATPGCLPTNRPRAAEKRVPVADGRRTNS